ncbi:MAG: SDR family NAD(P)-dependent oxidoreductase [Bacteroidia bacterium]
MKVKDKTIVITGGGNGIGRELVLALLEKGAKVAAVDLNETTLQETEKLAGEKSNNFSYYVMNIADKTAVENLPEQVIVRHGNIDGLINNAGIIQPFVRINDLDYKTIDRVVDVNFYGTLYMTKAFLPYLLKRPEAHIVNISSMGGFLPVPGQSIYGASKAAVKLLTEGLQAELIDTKVKVSIVFPGAVGTNIAANSGVKINRNMKTASKVSNIKPLPPAKAAQIIINGMEKNKKRIFVGRDSRMLDIMYRFSPNFAVSLITKQMKSLLQD